MKNLFSIIVLFLLLALLPFSSFAAERELQPCIAISHCVREEWDVSNIKTPFLEIERIVNNTMRTRIVESDNNYFHAEVTSRIMKYIDDLEVRYDPENNNMLVRSESRVGEGDFGVNQKRINKLKDQLFSVSG